MNVLYYDPVHGSSGVSDVSDQYQAEGSFQFPRAASRPPARPLTKLRPPPTPQVEQTQSQLLSALEKQAKEAAKEAAKREREAAQGTMYNNAAGDAVSGTSGEQEGVPGASTPGARAPGVDAAGVVPGTTPAAAAEQAQPLPGGHQEEDPLVAAREELERLEKRRNELTSLLAENRTRSHELHAKLKDIGDSDLRAFLELLYRAQVLEVERMELDHVGAMKRQV